jgi:hypothetical protein
MSAAHRKRKKEPSAEGTPAKAEYLGLKHLGTAIIRAGSEFSPIASATREVYDEYNNWRLDKFLEDLDARKTALAEEKEQNFRMVHVFGSCLRYVERTSSEPKIKLFSSAFQNYCETRAFESEEATEIYDENLAILNDLSYREFQILCILCNFERTVGDEQRDFWSEFFDSLESKLQISRDEIPGILQRLDRTGLYEPIQGFLSPSNGFIHGKLTPNFYSFFERFGWRIDNLDSLIQ